MPTLVEFFGARRASGSSAEGEAREPRGRQQRARAGARPQRLRRRREDPPRATTGPATFEFPHLLRLLDGLQYDTIYHEHFSYFSFATIGEILGAHGLEVYDVEELPDARRLAPRLRAARGRPARGRPAVADCSRARTSRGLRSPERYARFAEDVKESKRALLDLLIRLRREGKQVVGYGAPGQGQHAAQLLRHPHRPARLHGRPQPVQARPLTRRARTSRSIRRSGSRRRGRTTSSCCPGT